MTEKAFLWDGTGATTNAPYDELEFNSLVAHATHNPVLWDWDVVPPGAVTFMQWPVDNANVVPGYLSDLKLVGNGSASVYVLPGAAVVRDFTYINTETISLPIAPIVSAGNFRYDSVVLRLDYDNNTVRAVVLQGEEYFSIAGLSMPTLTQTEGLIWEVLLGYVLVEYKSPFYVQDMFIFDSRQFLFTHEHPAIAENNLIRNSEFMAFSGEQTVAVDPPEHWEFVGTPASCAAGTAYDPMTRGRSITLPASGTMTQRVYAKGGKTFTIKALVQNSASTHIGGYIYIWPYKEDGTLIPGYISRLVPTAGGAFFVEFQETFTFDSDEIDYLLIQLSAGLTPASFGQVILVEGYHPGPFRAFTEFIPFRSGLTDASWNTTAKSDGTTTIDLTASFGGVVLPRTKAVLVHAIARDSGTAATPIVTLSFSTVLSAVACGILNIGSVTNDVFRSGQFIVPVDTDVFAAAPAVTPRFDVTVDATGVLTMDVLLYIVGIYV